MGLVVGVNSYATVVEADEYLNDKIEAEEWFSLSDIGAPGAPSKSSYLVTAYKWLLSSPTLDLPKVSNEKNIKDAQIESAFYLLEHYTALNARRAAQAQGLKSFRLSKKWEEFVERDISEIPSFILGSLTSFITSNCVVQLRGQYDE